MYRWVDHTAELELAIEAPDEAGVFAEALRALGALLGADDARGLEVERSVSVTGRDRPALLAAWLDELAFLAETEGLVPLGVRRLELREDGLEATVTARRGAPPHLVKGATYHNLAFGPGDGGHRARVVLDV